MTSMQGGWGAPIEYGSCKCSTRATRVRPALTHYSTFRLATITRLSYLDEALRSLAYGVTAFARESTSQSCSSDSITLAGNNWWRGVVDTRDYELLKCVEAGRFANVGGPGALSDLRYVTARLLQLRARGLVQL